MLTFSKQTKNKFCFEKTTAELPKTQFVPRNIIVLEFILRKRTFSHLKHLETSVLLDLRPFLLLY